MAAPLTWPAPAAEYVNEGSTARSWMMPGGEYVMEAGTAAAVVNQPIVFVMM